jgi:putative heme-binding domain-containing protein
MNTQFTHTKFTAARISLFQAALCAALLAASPTFAAPAEVPADPEAERQSFKVADGFEVNLFASDPMIRKPIEMNFDPDGKLWVVSSSTYPQLKPGQDPDDKVIVLEDTKGEGKADKSTVFAEGLFIPTGIVPGDGGAYVANSTEVLFLKDTTGSGKADLRRVVLSGFGTEDTHHIIHAFNWGPDGRIYFNQSIYIHSHVETPWGTKTLLGSGTWRYRPETGAFDVYCRGQVNPWGIAWDEWGQTFETDGAGGEGIAFAFPGSAFQSAVGYEKVLPGLNPGSPKYCSLAVLSGSHMPDDWRGTFLTNDFRAHRICHFQLTDSGSGFVSKQLPDFIVSGDADFRPIDIKMGPDGAIYIADWYNPIINHGEVDFRDLRRDHVHGRIWRVTAKGRPLVERPKLSKAPVTDLLESLRSPEDYSRLRAKLVMRERGAKEIVPALAAWVKAISPRSKSAEQDRLEALWAYESMDVVEPELLNRVLGSKDFRPRAAAVRVLSHWASQIPSSMDLLTAAVDDESPRVRLEAIRALAAIPNPQSITIAARVLDKPVDVYLDWALTQTARDLEPMWMPAFKAGRLTTWAKPAHLSRALQDVKSPAAMGVLVEQLKGNQLPPDARNGVIDLIAAIDPKQGGQTLFDLATSSTRQPPAVIASRPHILDALAKISRDTHAHPDGAADRLKPLLSDKDDLLRAAAQRLAGAWQLETLRPELTQTAEDAAELPPIIRRSAIDALADLGGPQSIDELKKLSDPARPDAVRRLAIAALASLDPKEAANRAADVLVSGPADADPSVLLGAFVKRAGGADALAAALAPKKLPSDTARLSLRYLQSQGGEETALTDLLRKAAGLTSGPTKLTPEQMKQTIAEVMAKGNPVNGERIFRTKEAACFQCHAVGGVGGFLAPDLRAIGASSPVDYLIDSVLDPNKAVKDGFGGVTVVTKDGDSLSGIKVRQDDKDLVLRDATRQEIVIPLASIKQQKDVGSLMPTGLADTLTHQELLDLIRFLSELGKPGPYDVGNAQIARRWRVPQFVPEVEPTPELPLSVTEENSNWYPAYSLVSGELPTSAFTTRPGKKIALARTEVNVTAAGKSRILLNSTKGLDLWIDGKRVDAKEDTTVDLAAGVHAFIFRIDFAVRGKEGLKVEVQDVPGSGGHGQVVVGR